jgi:hypothetical protein
MKNSAQELEPAGEKQKFRQKERSKGMHIQKPFRDHLMFLLTKHH